MIIGDFIENLKVRRYTFVFVFFNCLFFDTFLPSTRKLKKQSVFSARKCKFLPF